MGDLNQQVRQFGEQLSRLTYPVNRLVMDPLVMTAHALVAQFGAHEGGPAVVGCVETQILRCRPDQKYALYLFVDALCRARSPFNFKQRFCVNLEPIFSSAYAEADEQNKDKLQRLLGIWQSKKLPHEQVFDSEVLNRTRSKIDPSFRYHPSAAPAPVVAAAGYPAYQQPAYVAAAPPAPMYAPAPVVVVPPPPPPPQDLVYDIAERLLRKINADTQLPAAQHLSLRDVYAMHPAFYQDLMAQAAREAQLAMSKVSYNAPASAGGGMMLPSPFASSSPVPLPAAVTTTPVLTPPPLVASSTTQLTDASVTQRTDRTLGELTLLMQAPGTAPLSVGGKKPLLAGHVPVRAWMPQLERWQAGEPTSWECVAKLFHDDGDDAGGGGEGEAAAAAAAAALAAQEAEALLGGGSGAGNPTSLVPKDESQPTCPLSGEQFDTVWDDDAQMWMYKQAIRPHAGGPIYKLEAWLAQHPNWPVDNYSSAKRARLG